MRRPFFVNAALAGLRTFETLGVAFACLGLGGMGVTQAEEVPAGYIVNKANLSAVGNQTFEGHSLGGMITPVMHKMISELGLTIKLAHSKPVVLPPSLLAATEKYSKGVKYDKTTRRISGYISGIPFPNLSDSDPDLADKIVWNHFYSYPQFTDSYVASSRAYLIDGTKGVERSSDLVNAVLRHIHRDSVEPVAPKFLGDGAIYRKTLLFNLAPQDIAGTGAYIQRYDDGRVDDSWAYIKSIRRVRRVSGGTWMDPVPGTVILNDDAACHSAFPTWYPKYKLVGKQWFLAVVHGVAPGYPGYKEEDLRDTKNPPYWNPINQPWEPREVYVYDAFPPEAHPYSRKRIYYDIQSNASLWCEMYDKKGQLWKMYSLPLNDAWMADGQPGVSGGFDLGIDFQRMQGSYFDVLYARQNDIRMDPDLWSPESLTKPERFSIQGLTKQYGGATWATPWARAVSGVPNK